MAYDEVLAQRIHDVLDGEPGLTTKKMFGGLGFMLDGHMAVAAGSGGALMVRVDPADGEAWIDGGAVAPMEMRGREMSGWLLVDRSALATEEQIGLWVGRGAAFVRTLPPK
ncbi:TfoX N-terminal domain-containing protein [Nocardioides exalbidus]|uniref:TfoX N-terminal domain-containing protein n=2 Tax=Nocardioides exalbidus TaxID=402596 RepID=A0A1H4WUW2_9ACTN|nr:TfoX N-terminal domain-containing protein [Nocardioides exalbidus]